MAHDYSGCCEPRFKTTALTDTSLGLRNHAAAEKIGYCISYFRLSVGLICCNVLAVEFFVVMLGLRFQTQLAM